MKSPPKICKKKTRDSDFYKIKVLVNGPTLTQILCTPTWAGQDCPSASTGVPPWQVSSLISNLWIQPSISPSELRSTSSQYSSSTALSRRIYERVELNISQPGRCHHVLFTFFFHFRNNWEKIRKIHVMCGVMYKVRHLR